jgi:ATP-dependent Lon protease
MFPLFVGREKTIQALNQAFSRQREVVLAIQRQSGVDEPGFEDVYEIGVLAQLLEIQRFPDGTLKVLVQARRRVVICRFVGKSGAFEAEVADLSEGPIPDAPELVKSVVKHFESYAASLEIRIPQTVPPLDQTRDPGRVADIIATHMILPIGDKQDVLAMVDPVARLKQIDALMDRPALSVSPVLEATRRRALDHANQRRHQYAALEHLLLALIDDADAAAVMAACNADLGALRASLIKFLDNDLKDIVIETGGDAKPTAAFQRVSQRAALHAQELGRAVVTGANTLMALFPETRSPAAQFLAQHGVSPGRAANFVAQGTGEGT